MGRKSTISRLPADVKTYIEGLMASGRWTLDEMIADLRDRFPAAAKDGSLPSRAALHRYGPKLERRLISVKAFTQAMESIDAHALDKADSRSSGLTAVMQQELFDSMMMLQDASDPEVDQAERVKLLADATRALASLTRSSVTLKQYQAKLEAEMRAATNAAASAVEKTAKKAGMSDETVAEIKARILGIVSDGAKG